MCMTPSGPAGRHGTPTVARRVALGAAACVLFAGAAAHAAGRMSLGPVAAPAVANFWRPGPGIGRGLRPVAPTARGGFAGSRGFYGGLGLSPRRLYAPQSGYWTHTLPVTPSYAIASRAGHVGMIVASVLIDGKGPFRFMLDTGATRTVLSSATAAKLALTASPGERVLVRGVSGLTAVPVVHIDSVSSGALQIRNVSAPVLSGPVLDGVDGILGMDGLSGMRLSADFVRDRVVIGTSSGDSQPALYALEGQFVSQRLLLVHGRIDGVLTAAVIDTGATHSLGNAALLAAISHGRHRPVAVSARDGVIDATNTDQPGSMQRIPALQFGAAAIRNLQVTFGDYPVFKTWGLQNQPALLLGMDVLGTLADFSIDYRRAELQVLPWPNS